MSTLLKISDAATLGLHAMLYMADHPERLVSTHEIAAHDGVSEAHLAKVLQRLVKVGLVKSTRGPKGGFTLGHAPDLISLMDIYAAIEGPLPEATGCCLFGTPVCERGHCLFGGLLHDVSRKFRHHLLNSKLSEFAKPKGKVPSHAHA